MYTVSGKINRPGGDKMKYIWRSLATLLFVLILSCGVMAQNRVHISAVGTESNTEVSAGQMRSIGGLGLVYTTYTASDGKLTYVLESADSRQPQVGHDYEVVRYTNDTMVLFIPNNKKNDAKPGSFKEKRQHEAQETTFHIKSVSENK
jgi:hypothetical protein